MTLIRRILATGLSASAMLLERGAPRARRGRPARDGPGDRSRRPAAGRAPPRRRRGARPGRAGASLGRLLRAPPPTSTPSTPPPAPNAAGSTCRAPPGPGRWTRRPTAASTPARTATAASTAGPARAASPTWAGRCRRRTSSGPWRPARARPSTAVRHRRPAVRLRPGRRRPGLRPAVAVARLRPQRLLRRRQDLRGTEAPAAVFEVDAATGVAERLPAPPGLDLTDKWAYDVNAVAGFVYVRFGSAFPGPLHVWDIAAHAWTDAVESAARPRRLAARRPGRASTSSRPPSWCATTRAPVR